MLEQEIASIIKFTLEKSGNLPPYYNEVREGFILPSVYYPVPEVTSAGDTFNTYALEYTWYIKFFHVDKTKAYERAFTVMTEIRAARNVIPLIDMEGNNIGRGFRLNDPRIKALDGSPDVAQLTLSWRSTRLYRVSPTQKMINYRLTMITKKAYESAIIMNPTTK